MKESLQIGAYTFGSLYSGEIRVLAKLFGGQGTNNVPSWSPDSRRLAFVSYRLVADGD